nr:copia protein [Tanacetum cinerariifolium]
MSSEEEPKVVRKYDDASRIEEWVSDDEEEDAEAVSTACYVQNRVVVVKPYNKISYELFYGRTPTLSFMRPFGCPVTILNTIDHLGKFDGKADEGTQSNGFSGTKASDNAGQARKETKPIKNYILLPLWTADPLFVQVPKSSHDNRSKPSSDDGKKVDEDPRKESECSKWASRNKKDEKRIVIKNKARLVAQRYTQEEWIDYDEVFAPVSKIKAIKLFLTYASFKDFVVYQMDVKSDFLYEKIKEEVYVCQPLGFEDPDFPNRVYKVEKAMYGLQQAPRAWFTEVKTASTSMETQKPLLKNEDCNEIPSQSKGFSSSRDHEDDDEEADMNNMDTTIQEITLSFPSLIDRRKLKGRI